MSKKVHYERPSMSGVEGYVPGEQPTHPRLIKLNTNENPYPPPACVVDAIAAVAADQLRRYPPPLAKGFREAAGAAHGLSADHVIATNGGDELLRLVITVFCTPAVGGGGLAVEAPTYSLYETLAEIHDTPLTAIPLDDTWNPPADFARKVIDAGCRLAIIVNPHAPSGRLLDVERLDAIARELADHAVLLVDEAYVDFAERDAVPLLDPARGLDNVLLLRTLSKGYSLAGIRFGYGLGHPGLIAVLDRARDSYNTDILAQAAATAAIEARDEAAASWKAVIDERTRLTESLTAQGYSVIPSQSNFVLASPPTPLEAAEVFESLKQTGIFVRYFTQERLRDKLRITIGTPEQNDALLEALAEIARQVA